MNCPHCGLKFSDPTFASSTEGTCPNCGRAFGAESPVSESPISQYFDDLKTLLLKPKSFFRRMPRNAGLAQPLAFALIAHWLGSALGHLWNTLSSRSGEEVFRRTLSFFGQTDQIEIISRNAQWESARHSFMNWFWGTGSVIIDPFLTLISLLITSFFVFVGARILVGTMSDAPGAKSPHRVTYESAVRIMAYGAVASIFNCIPWVGALIASIYGFYISLVGAREVYRVGTGRGVVIVLFPRLLVLGLFLAFAGIAFLIAFKLFSLFAIGGF